MNENVIVESRTLRQQLCTNEKNLEILDRVGQLMMLPGDSYTTTEKLAEFYMVSKGTIDWLIKNNRDELVTDGYKVIPKKNFCDLDIPSHKLKEFGISPKARYVGFHTKRSALRAGILLRDSPVAKQVRTHLLDIEARSTQISQQTLAQMANQLTLNAVQLSAQSSQLTKHAGQLSEHAIILEQNAIHSEKEVETAEEFRI